MNQVNVFCVCLLVTTFDLSAAQNLKPRPCPTCAEGYFVKKNCSVTSRRIQGVQCRRCTDCSAAHQDVLVPCSTFADSMCRNQTAPAAPTHLPDSAAWITVIVFTLFLVLLLSLFLTLLSCTTRNKVKGVDQL